MDKQQLRHEMIEKRSALPDAAERAQKMAAVFEKIVLPDDFVVASYFPLKSEMDTRPLMDFLLGQNMTVCLPVVVAENEPLLFKKYDKDTPLIKGRYGIFEPDSETVIPDVMLLPLLAFDRHGGRLGMGGGYYDRTLREIRKKKTVFAIGIGFACQEVDLVPKEPWDESLDMIVTEEKIIKVS